MNARKRWWGGLSLRKAEIAKLEKVHATLWTCLWSGTRRGKFSKLWRRKEEEGATLCYHAANAFASGREPPKHCEEVIPEEGLVEWFCSDVSKIPADYGEEVTSNSVSELSDTWPSCSHCASMGIIEELVEDADRNLLGKSWGNAHFESFLSGYEDEVDDWWEEVHEKVREKIEDDWAGDSDNPFFPDLFRTINFILFNEGLREALDRYGPSDPDGVGDETSERIRRCGEWLAEQESMESLWIQCLMSNLDKTGPYNEISAHCMSVKDRATLYAIWMEEYHPQSRAISFLKRASS